MSAVVASFCDITGLFPALVDVGALFEGCTTDKFGVLPALLGCVQMTPRVFSLNLLSGITCGELLGNAVEKCLVMFPLDEVGTRGLGRLSSPIVL